MKIPDKPPIHAPRINIGNSPPKTGKKAADLTSALDPQKVAGKVASKIQPPATSAGLAQEWSGLQKADPSVAETVSKFATKAKDQIASAEKQIASERDAATNAFTYAIVGAAVSAVAGALGPIADSMRTAASALFPLKSQFPAMFESFKSGAAQMDTDRAQLNQQRLEMAEATLDEAIDETKANYEDSREQFDKALQIIETHMELQTQVVQKITS